MERALLWSMDPAHGSHMHGTGSPWFAAAADTGPASWWGLSVLIIQAGSVDVVNAVPLPSYLRQNVSIAMMDCRHALMPVSAES